MTPRALFLETVTEWLATLEETRCAVDLDPLSPMAHHMLALVLLGLGRTCNIRGAARRSPVFFGVWEWTRR